MRRILQSCLLLVGLLSSTASWAIMIMGNDVGSVDNIIGATNDLDGANPLCGPGSDPASEMCWASDQPGVPSLSYSTKNSGVAVIYNVGRTLAAFKLESNPAYFLVKNAQAWVLLENNSRTNWGVLDLTDSALSGLKLNLGKADQLTISHVTEFNGSKSVPEPAGLAFAMAGILGLSLLRRRNRRA